jgi:pimeloyl-ACP methyl ester carboxylesterase
MRWNGIDYDRTGEGEPLLLLHGTGGSRRHLRPVIDTLASHHDVIAVDLPGHGESDAPPAHGDHSPVGYGAKLADFLDELGIASAHVAGDSVGGWTALELAKLGKRDRSRQSRRRVCGHARTHGAASSSYGPTTAWGASPGRSPIGR